MNQKIFKNSELKKKYEHYYENQKIKNLFPSEFLVKIFLSQNHEFIGRKKYNKLRLLDLSFGDGRNLNFFKKLGFKVYGTEISNKIINKVKNNLKSGHKDIVFKVGKSNYLPFKKNYFDYIVAHNSFYYLDENIEIEENLREIKRVMKKNSFFIGTAPKTNNYYFRNASKLGNKKYLIKNDFLKIRNNSIICGFKSKNELKKLLQKFFKKISIGHSFNEFFKTKEYLYNFIVKNEK
jgi:ubiquinone/menaquinone biosynthesis C-methylase UbiE